MRFKYGKVIVVIVTLIGLFSCGGAQEPVASNTPEDIDCSAIDIANGKVIFESSFGCADCHMPFENGISMPTSQEWPVLDANDTVWGLTQEAMDANYELNDYIAWEIIGIWASEPEVDCPFDDVEAGTCKPANDAAAYIKSHSDSPWCQ